MKSIPGISVKAGDFMLSVEGNKSFVYSLVLKVIQYKNGRFELILLHDNAICPYGPFMYTVSETFELFESEKIHEYKTNNRYHNHAVVMILQAS